MHHLRYVYDNQNQYKKGDLLLDLLSPHHTNITGCWIIYFLTTLFFFIGRILHLQIPFFYYIITSHRIIFIFPIDILFKTQFICHNNNTYTFGKFIASVYDTNNIADSICTTTIRAFTSFIAWIAMINPP